jgi:hypothetical protein
MCKNGKLLWFKTIQKTDNGTAKGYLLLSDCSVSTLPAANGRYPLRLSPKRNRKKDYNLTATSEQECTDWVRAIIEAGAAGEVPQQHSVNFRRQSVNAEPSSASPSSATVQGDLAAIVGPGGGAGGGGANGSLRHQSLPPKGSRREARIDPKAAQSVKLLGDLAPAAEKSGWLEKKGKRRWFVLKDGAVSWYNQPKHHQSGANPNGSLKTGECYVDQIGEMNGLYAFTIYSKNQKEADYVMMASSSSEMEDWVIALLLSGASTDRKTVTSGREETAQLEEETKPRGGALPDVRHFPLYHSFFYLYSFMYSDCETFTTNLCLPVEPD